MFFEKNFKIIMIAMSTIILVLNSWFVYEIFKNIAQDKIIRERELLLSGFSYGQTASSKIFEKWYTLIPTQVLKKGEFESKVWFDEYCRRNYKISILEKRELSSEEYAEITNRVSYNKTKSIKEALSPASVVGSVSFTSMFGMRNNPHAKNTGGDGNKVEHKGIDIGVEINTPVYAFLSGTVIKSGNYRGYGTVLMLFHSYMENGKVINLVTLYAHLNKSLVKTSDYVTRGNQIALSGNTGKSTGAHLHFEVFQIPEDITQKTAYNFVDNLIRNNNGDYNINPIDFYY